MPSSSQKGLWPLGFGIPMTVCTTRKQIDEISGLGLTDRPEFGMLIDVCFGGKMSKMLSKEKR